MKFKKWNISTPAEQDVALLRSAGYPYLLSTVLAARGITTAEAAAEFVLACIRRTEPEHWYGVRFEPVLYTLAAKAAGIDLPAAGIDLSE